MSRHQLACLRLLADGRRCLTRHRAGWGWRGQFVADATVCMLARRGLVAWRGPGRPYAVAATAAGRAIGKRLQGESA